MSGGRRGGKLKTGNPFKKLKPKMAKVGAKEKRSVKEK